MKRDVSHVLNSTQGQERWLPCSTCGVATRHLVLVSAEVNGKEDEVRSEFWFAWTQSLEVVQCQGCMNGSFRSIYSDSEMDEHEASREELFPKRLAGRKQLERTYFLPFKIRLVYEESLSALSNGLPVLAAIGIRALVETVCKEQKASGKDLEKRIDALVEKGVLTKDAAEILHSPRIMGNKAAHEVKPHTPSELLDAWEVVEHLLLTVYLLPKIASSLPSRGLAGPEGAQQLLD